MKHVLVVIVNAAISHTRAHNHTVQDAYQYIGNHCGSRTSEDRKHRPTHIELEFKLSCALNGTPGKVLQPAARFELLLRLQQSQLTSQSLRSQGRWSLAGYTLARGRSKSPQNKQTYLLRSTMQYWMSSSIEPQASAGNLTPGEQTA